MARDFFPTFLTAATRQLAPLGFTPLLRGTFQKPLASGVDAWLGINYAFYSEGLGSLRLVPRIGVRHVPLERRLAEIAPREHRPDYPTVAKNIDALMPRAQRGYIYVNGPDFVEPAAITLADRVRTYGLPFAESLIDLSRLADALSGSRIVAAYYRLPVALILLGDAGGARSALTKLLERFPPSFEGPIADAFRGYAADFLAALDARAG
jgi:hypothetical protein